jgi:DHA2 family multidrug resistance protein
VDPRRLLAVGIVLGSLTMFDLSGLNLNAGFWDIFWAQVLQGVALSFLFIPLMSLAMSHISQQKMGNATSIFNLMRNIGGSIGIALMTTFLARRAQVHQNHLVANVTAGSGETARLMQAMRANFIAHGIDGVTATRKALGAVYGLVQQHAAMLAFVEAFFVMGVVFLLMLPFLPLLQYSKAKRPVAAGAGAAAEMPASDVPPQWVDETVPEAYDEEHHLVMH